MSLLGYNSSRAHRAPPHQATLEALPSLCATLKWGIVHFACSVICIAVRLRAGSNQNIILNRLTPNEPYMGRTAPLTSKLCILYIYSTNIGTEYFKHALYPPFFSLKNAICFIMLTSLVPVLFTFYIQDVLK